MRFKILTLLICIIAMQNNILAANRFFKISNSYYILADNVNIRSTASQDAKVIANLPIGTKVIIKEVTKNNTLTIAGYEQNWVKIQFNLKDKIKEGFVWGGLVALVSIQDHDDKNLLYHFGVKSLKTIYNKKYNLSWYEGTIQVSISKNHKQIAKTIIKSVGHPLNFTTMKLFYNKGIKQIKTVIKINFDASVCAGAFGDIYIFWDGKNLFHPITLRHGIDAPMFLVESLIFPNDKGGQKGKIIWKSLQGEHNDDGSKKIIERKKKIYKWNGTKLNATK